MAFVWNRVAFLTATTGTGALTAGAAMDDRSLTPDDAGVPNGAVPHYLIREGSDFELGTGSWNSGTGVLTRTTVLVSKIAGTVGLTKMNLAGNAVVRFVASAEDFTAARIVFSPTGAISATDVQAAIAELDTEKAPLASPAFTGNPTAPTPSPGDNDTSIATTGFVKAAIDVVLGGVSSAFDTLSEIATALAGKRKQGKETIWVPAGAMKPRVTSGAGTSDYDSGSNDVTFKTMDFDTASVEIGTFHVAFPKSWDLGTVTFIPYWTADSGSGGVVWACRGVALSDDDALNASQGTEQFSIDTLITAGDLHVGAESSAITIIGTPAAGDLVVFEIVREVANGSDTLGVDARLIGVKILFNTNAADDT